MVVSTSNRKAQQQEHNDNSIVVVDTLVVGAGLSGASAVDSLCSHYYNNSSSSKYRIALVEARERPGGRSCTMTELVDGGVACSVDVGGQWLGACHSEMLALCRRFGLETEEQSFPPPQSTSNLNNENTKDASPLIEMAYYELKPISSAAQLEIQNFESFLKDCYLKLEALIVKEQQDDVTRKQVLRIEAPWDTLSFQDMVERHCALPDAREQYAYFCQTVLAVNPHHCSFLFFLYYAFVWGGGGVRGMELLGDGPDGFQALKVKGGVQQVSEQLLHETNTNEDDAPVNAKVYYGREVQKIDSSHKSTDAVAVVTSAAGANDANGDDQIIFHCNHVILAMSPTLFYKSVTFTPQLSPQHTALYDFLGMGCAVKVIVAFPKAFWKNDATTTKSTTSLLSIAEVGVVSNIFESTVGPYPALVCLITGDQAIKYHSTPDKRDRQQLVLSQLKTMYVSSNHDHDVDVCDPIVYMEKDWISEQYSGGCFAAVVKPSDASVFANHKHLLQEPIVPGKVFVAGTESSTQFFGYLEGAVLAGKRAAVEVIACLADL